MDHLKCFMIFPSFEFNLFTDKTKVNSGFVSWPLFMSYENDLKLQAIQRKLII